MPVFHAPSHCASHRARGEKALARLVEQVNALRARPVTGEDFEEMEREFRALFAEAEREVVGETLERLDMDLPFVEIEGRRYRRVLRSHATYTSAAGAVGVHRTLYRCGGERAVAPMELRAGIVAGHWTVLAARQAKGRAHYEKLRHLLRHELDGVEKVIRSLNHLRRTHPGNKRIAEVLGYLRNNRHRMGYAEAKAQNLPIGSGVVEAACKTLVTQRMKRSGMRWRHAGGLPRVPESGGRPS